MSIDQKLQELGIELPGANPPVANYVPFVQEGKLVFISGQTAKWNGELHFAGKVGKDYTVEEGQEAARLCGLNLLVQLRSACGGDLDQVARCVKLTVFVNSASDFTAQAQVANGVSDLMVEVFGEAGRHARAAVGANVLPSDSAVEVEAIFALR